MVKDMRFANAIYEHHDTNPKIEKPIYRGSRKYVRFEFGSHYKEMLKQTELYGSVVYNVE
jgi:hypothetical protein